MSAADEMNHTPHHWSYLQMLEHPNLQIASQISPLFLLPGNMRHREVYFCIHCLKTPDTIELAHQIMSIVDTIMYTVGLLFECIFKTDSLT